MYNLYIEEKKQKDLENKRKELKKLISYKKKLKGKSQKLIKHNRTNTNNV